MVIINGLVLVMVAALISGVGVMADRTVEIAAMKMNALNQFLVIFLSSIYFVFSSSFAIQFFRWLSTIIACDKYYEWTCRGDGSRIDVRRRCDGRPDCRDRSDEYDCPQLVPSIFEKSF